jgi:transposase
MYNRWMFLSDEQWAILQPILDPPRPPKRGRPWKDGRAVLEAILFILHTGIQWEHLPKTFPPKSTVHDRLQLWSENQAFRRLLAVVVRSLVQKGRIDLENCFVDATFAPAKGGGAGVGLTRKGKGTKVQLIVDGQGLPLGASLAAADVAECHMVQETLDLFAGETFPDRLIGDKAYDSDALDDALAEFGLEMIAPHRKGRRPENVTQDGRPLRRYRHRWIVERTIAWLGARRRLLVRWEKKLGNFVGFTLLGCLGLLLHRLAPA